MCVRGAEGLCAIGVKGPLDGSARSDFCELGGGCFWRQIGGVGHFREVKGDRQVGMIGELHVAGGRWVKGLFLVL